MEECLGTYVCFLLQTIDCLCLLMDGTNVMVGNSGAKKNGLPIIRITIFYIHHLFIGDSWCLYLLVLH